MLLGACRRLLRNQQDAEDVLQATFLVLARQASAIRRQESVGSWLYGVAYRLALKLRTRQARQQECERQAATTAQARSAEQMTWADLQPVLDEELQRLPDKYRAPILLCCLEGKSRDEAARELGWPEGAVKIRLERGRELLRKRLARRGVTLSAALWAVLVTKDVATAAMPVRLTATLVEAGLRFAARQTLVGTVPAAVLALTDSCLKTMALAKLQMLAAGLLLLVVLGLGSLPYATVATPQTAPSDPSSGAVALAPASAQQPPQQLPEIVPPAVSPKPSLTTGTLSSTQVADQRRITIQPSSVPDPAPSQRERGREPRPAPVAITYRLRADARILINGEAARFADLQPGMEVRLELGEDQKTVVCLQATAKQ
jgi:RNA polymerase sigma factor (sigma-70 family)